VFNNRRPQAFQRNGAPVGFGQQRGNSLYLDQPGVNTSGADGVPQQSEQSFMQNLAGVANRIRDQRVKAPKQMGGDAYAGALAQADQPGMNDKPAFMKALESGFGDTAAAQGGPVREAPSISTAAPQAAAQGAAPWQRGQIVGGARQGQADFARLGGGFGDANTDSLKHTFGRIAQNFANTPEGLSALMQDEEFRRLFPNATVNKDWIDFGGQLDPHTNTRVGKVDVMHAWDPTNNSGKNWQWLTEEEALASSQPAQGQAPMMNTSNASPLMQALLGNVPSGGVDLNALLQQLLQGQTGY
jgi:hypothetical protein